MRSNPIRCRLCAAVAVGGVLLAAVACPAQEDADVKAVSDRVAAFLDDLSDDPTAAFKTLLDKSSLAGTEDIQRLTAAAAEFPKKYGTYIGSERVAHRKVGQDLILLTYLYKSERFPIVWRFAFYRPRTTWNLVSVRFDSKLLELELPATAP